MAVASVWAAVLSAILAVGSAGAEVKSNPANFAAQIVSAVRDKVMYEMSAPGKEVESVDVSLPEKLKRPDDYDAMEVDIQSVSPSGDRVFVTVSFRKNKRVIARHNLSAEIKLTLDAYVATRELKRGMTLAAGDVRLERVPAGPWFEKYVADLDDLLGKQVERNLKEGTPIRLDHVSRPKMVNSGDSVMIIAEKGALRITAPGKARQDGELGEWIKVINVDSSKALTAKVTGPGEVSVEF